MVLAWIRDYLMTNGWPPTLQEIASNYGWTRGGARVHVLALERKGHLTRVPKRARSISVPGATWCPPNENHQQQGGSADDHAD